MPTTELPANVRRFLDISTHHLPEHLAADLNGQCGVIAHETPYGWLLYVPNPDPEDESDDAPAEVKTIWARARQFDCAYVLLDSDADIDDELPYWSW